MLNAAFGIAVENDAVGWKAAVGTVLVAQAVGKFSYGSIVFVLVGMVECFKYLGIFLHDAIEIVRVHNAGKKGHPLFHNNSRIIAQQLFQTLINEKILPGAHVVHGYDRRRSICNFLDKVLIFAKLLFDSFLLCYIL